MIVFLVPLCVGLLVPHVSVPHLGCVWWVRFWFFTLWITEVGFGLSGCGFFLRCCFLVLWFTRLGFLRVLRFLYRIAPTWRPSLVHGIHRASCFSHPAELLFRISRHYSFSRPPRPSICFKSELAARTLSTTPPSLFPSLSPTSTCTESQKEERVCMRVLVK